MLDQLLQVGLGLLDLRNKEAFALLRALVLARIMQIWLYEVSVTMHGFLVEVKHQQVLVVILRLPFLSLVLTFFSVLFKETIQSLLALLSRSICLLWLKSSPL